MRTLRFRASLVALSAAFGVAGLLAGGCQEESDGDKQSTSCPAESVPRVRPEVRAVAFAYGEGPVFAGLGTGDGVVRYTVDTRSHEGWHYYKTLWAIAPSYGGEVVVTGKQIGGDEELRFNPGAEFPGPMSLRLRFPPDDSGKWRYGPSETLIRAPGCYAFRVAGQGFEQTIAFEARD